MAEDNEQQSKATPRSEDAEQGKARQGTEAPAGTDVPKEKAPASDGESKPVTPKPPPPKPQPPAKPKGPAREPWSEPLVAALKQKFTDDVIDAYTFLSERQLVIQKDRVSEIMAYLRNNDIEPFDFLSDETATHWPKEEEFEIVYMLFSFKTHGRVRVKARIKEWEPIESLVSIWPGANWLEREAYDMFGIQFANHPNLERILLPEDWVGYPLRKDYDLRLQDVEWVRKHLGIDSGQKFYVGKAKHGED